MSSAYKCDRCGKLFPIRKLSFSCVLMKLDKTRLIYSEYDLCPQCQNELERWFHNVQG